MKKIDLHVHTTASDGTCTPAQAVETAAQLGLSAIAITDHDTISGYAEAKEAGDTCGVEVVPGIEISTKYFGAVHILGYYINTSSQSLHELLQWVVNDRDERNTKIAKLMADDGLPVTYEAMQQRFGEVIGRPHFAELLVEFGLATDMKDAFQRFVNKGMRYYLPRQILPLERAVTIIVEAGGIPVLAHPFQYKLDDARLCELIEHCMSSGLRGMECRYSGYTSQQSAYLETLAEKYHLLKTGGSDFHGSNKPQISMGSGMGELDVPYPFLEELKKNL